MIGLDRLRSIIERELHQRTPQAIELRMPGEVLLLAPVPEAAVPTASPVGLAASVINEIYVRGVEEVELVRIDATYLPEHDFLYALTVEVK